MHIRKKSLNILFIAKLNTTARGGRRGRHPKRKLVPVPVDEGAGKLPLQGIGHRAPHGAHHGLRPAPEGQQARPRPMLGIQTLR